MGAEILSQQTVVGHDQEDGQDVGVVKPRKRADGTIYRVDVGYADTILCNLDDSLSFQMSLGGEFDHLLIAGVEEKSKRIGQEKQSEMSIILLGRKK